MCQGEEINKKTQLLLTETACHIHFIKQEKRKNKRKAVRKITN